MRSTTLRLAAWLALVFLSLRPLPQFERLVDLALSPLRMLAEVAPPLTWIRPVTVNAAEAEIANLAEEEAQAIAALQREMRVLALPTRAELIDGRELVVADVLGYDDVQRDRIRIQLQNTGGVRPDCPVVCGNSYVGRIVELDHGTGVAEVDLVTGRSFFVGARVVPDEGEARDATVRMTVGGLESRVEGRSRRTYLAVHNPSERRIPAGRVVVDELVTTIDPYGQLANGYELGRVAADELGRPLAEPPLVVPNLDFASGLFEVYVLSSTLVGDEEGTQIPGALEDFQWHRVRALTGGDPNPLRQGIRVTGGWESGIRGGSALVSGARILGRVERPGWGTSGVRMLTDRGLSLAAVARFDGLDAPVLLGEIQSLGLDDTGAVRFRMRDSNLLPAELREREREALLFTGTGRAGLPSGLVIGRARVGPLEEGRPEIRLELEFDPYEVRDLWVRITGEGPGR